MILGRTVNMKEKNLRVHSPCSANWAITKFTNMMDYFGVNNILRKTIRSFIFQDIIH